MARRILFFFYLCFLPFALKAQPPATPDGLRQPRILILLDGSSSMLTPWGTNLQRFSAAAKVVSALMDSIYAVNNSVEFGLRVYGHTAPAQENNCTDTRREVMFSKNNATQMALRLASLHPLGVSPIAYSLKEAATYDLDDEQRNAYSIILITDGGESCGGDICAVMAQLIQRKIFFRPYIIGLADYALLKDQYACVGTYLQATKESDIPTAIKTITDAYRPMLQMPIMVASKPLPATVTAPEVKVIPVPVKVYVPETTAVVALSIVTRNRQPERSFPMLALALVKVPEIKFAAAPVRVQAPETAVASLSIVTRDRQPERFFLMPLPRTITTFPTFPKISRDPAPMPVVAVVPKPVVVVPEPVIKKPDPPIVKPVIKDTAKTTVTIKPLPVIKPLTPVKPPKTDTKTQEIKAITSVEDSKETTAAIYFTDGHGKFYHTSPSIQLLDPKTGKEVKTFYRTVGPSGEPDLQNIPAGTYNLIVAGRSNLITRNVVVQASKNNKIIIPVMNGSINFVYAGAPDRPVEEFVAKVKIRFDEGAQVFQKCTQELPYPPGNYYIEVNTLPITRFNADVDFGSSTELSLPEPGFVEITNVNALGKITFYYPLGDRYAAFKDLQVTGNPEAQRLRLKPGAYEVHWPLNPALPNNGDHIQKFLVKANSVTEVALH